MNGEYIHHPIQHPAWTTVIGHDDHEDDEYDHDEDDPRLQEHDKVRRRSSKACDQCRKNKCKCERTGGPDDPCRNCVLLNTDCTFLGPSRKRGPPKGYIDAIENRLHQTEALVGALVNSSDPRAVSLLRDISLEPSARDIIERVTLSPYGSKTRKKKDTSAQGEPTHSRGKAGEIYTGRLQPFDRPISEWQDMIGNRIMDATNSRLARGGSVTDGVEIGGMSTRDAIRRRTGAYVPTISQHQQQQQRLSAKQSFASIKSGHESEDSAQSPDGSDDDDLTPGFGQLSLNEHEQFRYHGKVSGLHILGRHRRLDRRNEGGVWRFPAPNIYVGQGAQADDSLATHSSSFGFQPSQPHPAVLDRSHLIKLDLERDIRKRLPSRDDQEHLLNLFWIYVHPVLPILDKEAVMEAWRAEAYASRQGNKEESGFAEDIPAPAVGDSPPQQSDSQSRGEKSPSPYVDASESPSTKHSEDKSIGGTQSLHPQARVPLLLLLSIFSISARFSTRSPPEPPEPSQKWDAGDSAVADRFLAAARTLLNHTYSSSRPSTCQALLLLSYREIGVGAMAAAWLYTGMAVRMAQDLGMHRKAEKWAWRTDDGGRGVFTRRERQVRKKIWYGCVIMDKYVSTYIGRPLSIFALDFDTPLPDTQEPEEAEMWTDDSSDPILDDEGLHSAKIRPPVQSYILSCFNQSAKLSGLLSEIVINIYSVHPPPPPSSRHTEYVKLEEKLDKWLLELPLHLSLDKFQHQHQQNVNARVRRSDSSSSPLNPHLHGGEPICTNCSPPAPHVFTLHMHYWCTVLLLHRPFIRVRSQSPNIGSPPFSVDSVLSHGSEKPFDLCMSAASHITSIVSLFAEHHCLLRCPAFFTYYIFSAGIMYVTALTIQPDHPQAGLGLQKCMDILKRMDRTWSSAGRQWELLRGSQLDLKEAGLARFSQGVNRNKRSLDEAENVGPQFSTHNVRDNLGLQPSRLVTNFVVPSNEAGASPHSRSSTASGPLSGNIGLYHPSTQPAPRPYNLGLDYAGHSLSTPTNPSLYHSQRSLFPQFERWFAPAPQGADHQPQSSVYGNGAQMNSSMGVSQIPRLPVSSARLPSFWNEHDEPSMMSSSLYNLPILSGGPQDVNLQPATQPLYPGTYYSNF